MCGKIYKLTSTNTDKIYIGATTEPLNIRLSKHKNSYSRYNAGKFHYISAFDICQFDDLTIELIEEIDGCRSELLKREGDLIANTANCVNRYITGRSPAEYYEHHKLDIKRNNKERIICDNCGANVCRGALYSHKKSKKCQR